MAAACLLSAAQRDTEMAVIGSQSARQAPSPAAAGPPTPTTRQSAGTPSSQTGGAGLQRVTDCCRCLGTSEGLRHQSVPDGPVGTVWPNSAVLPPPPAAGGRAARLYKEAARPSFPSPLPRRRRTYMAVRGRPTADELPRRCAVRLAACLGRPPPSERTCSVYTSAAPLHSAAVLPLTVRDVADRRPSDCSRSCSELAPPRPGPAVQRAVSRGAVASWART